VLCDWPAEQGGFQSREQHAVRCVYVLHNYHHVFWLPYKQHAALQNVFLRLHSTVPVGPQSYTALAKCCLSATLRSRSTYSTAPGWLRGHWSHNRC
jgi:hypothetical protein